MPKAIKISILKQTARLILLFVCGLAVSLGFTWWSVKFHESQRTQGWIKLLGFPYFDQYADPSMTERFVGQPNASGDAWVIVGRRNKQHRVFQVYFEASQYRNGMEEPLEPGVLPDWIRTPPTPTKEEMAAGVIRFEQVGGWPLRSWRGDWQIDNRSVSGRSLNSFPDSPVYGSLAFRDVVLYPFEPIFPGVILNAILFGACTFLFWVAGKMAFVRIREYTRVRDLRCPNCKYNCTGLKVCPECGHELGSDHLAVKFLEDKSKD